MTYVPYELTQAFALAAPAIGVVFSLSLLLSALMYLIGTFFSDHKLITMAKDNAYQVIMTGLLIGAFISLFAGLSAFSNVLDMFVSTPFVTTGTYLSLAQHCAIYDLHNVVDAYSQLTLHDIAVGVFAYTTFSVPVMGGNVLSLGLKSAGRSHTLSIFELSFQPFGGLAPIAADLTHITQLLTLVLIMVIARVEILNFVVSVVPIFFVVGLMLRSFIFTKRTGTSLIVFCTVLYFVFPLSVILTHYLAYDLYKPLIFSFDQGAFSAPTMYSFTSSPQEVQAFAQDYAQYEKNFVSKFGAINSEAYNSARNPVSSFVLFVVNFISETLSVAWKVLIAGLETTYSVLRSLMHGNGWFLAGLPSGVSVYIAYYNMILGEIQAIMQLPAILFLCFVCEIMITISSYRSVAIMIDSELELFGITKYI